MDAGHSCATRRASVAAIVKEDNAISMLRKPDNTSNVRAYVPRISMEEEHRALALSRWGEVPIHQMWAIVVVKNLFGEVDPIE
jgi:hypothetical protein